MNTGCVKLREQKPFFCGETTFEKYTGRKNMGFHQRNLLGINSGRVLCQLGNLRTQWRSLGSANRRTIAGGFSSKPGLITKGCSPKKTPGKKPQERVPTKKTDPFFWPRTTRSCWTSTWHLSVRQGCRPWHFRRMKRRGWEFPGALLDDPFFCICWGVSSCDKPI